MGHVVVFGRGAGELCQVPKEHTEIISELKITLPYEMFSTVNGVRESIPG